MRSPCTRAQALGVKNFSVLVSQVPGAARITAVLQSPGNRVRGFLGPGHVCTVMGTRDTTPSPSAITSPS
jgi:hydrogenase expression/formation protein HypD